MANVELITCDHAGCTKPFAYRVKGFNLCAKHCFAPDELRWAIIDAYLWRGNNPPLSEFLAHVRQRLAQEPRGEHGEILATGAQVTLVNQKPGQIFTVESSDLCDGRRFYRLKEVEGGVFLRESLREKP